jgi:hypothetical protein
LIRWNQRAPRNVSWPFNIYGAAHAAFTIQFFPVERNTIFLILDFQRLRFIQHPVSGIKSSTYYCIINLLINL